MPQQDPVCHDEKNTRRGISRACRNLCFILSATALSGFVLNGCESKAKVQWEDKERSNIQNKIGTIISDTELSVLYNSVSASLSEEERPLLNSIVTTIMERNPSQANKAATLKAVLGAVESLKANEEMRGKFSLSLATLLEISKRMDASVLRIAEAIATESEGSRLKLLSTADVIVTRAETSETLKGRLEAVAPKLEKVNFGRIISLWNSFASDSEKQEQMLISLLTAANDADSAELSKLLLKIESGVNRDDIFLVLKEMKYEDKNLPLFVKMLNRVNLSSYPHLILMLGISSDPSSPEDIVAALLENLRKAVPLSSSLIDGYVASAGAIVDGQDALVQLNTLTTSVDTLSGEGFFVGVGFANRYISDREPLECKVFGQGSEKISYSFQWTKNSVPEAWSAQSSSNSNVRSSSFSIGEKVLCSVKVYLDGVLATQPALESDLVTVKAAPPRFASGDTPADQRLTMSQGGRLSVIPEAYTYTGTSAILYTISVDPLRGNAFVVGPSEIIYEPLRSFTGEDSFKYRACDNEGNCSAEKRVFITVNRDDLPPLINGLFSVSAGVVNNVDETINLLEDLTAQTAPLIQVIVDDDSTSLGECKMLLSVASSDTSKLENTESAIKVEGTFPFCKMTLLPQSNVFGSLFLTLSLTDGKLNRVPTMRVYKLIISDVNDAPTMTSIVSPQGTNEDTTKSVSFTLADVDGPLSCTSTHLSYRSSNTNLVAATGAVSWSGTWPLCTGTITPSLDKYGTSEITFIINDGKATQEQSFTLNVASVRDAPVIEWKSPAHPYQGTEDVPLQVEFRVRDPENVVDSCDDVLKVSNNTSLVSSSGIVISGGTSLDSCKATVTPLPNKNQGVSITFSINNSFETSSYTREFNFAIVNDPPTIDSVDDTSTPEYTPKSVDVTIRDVDNSLECTADNITLESSIGDLLPSTNITMTEQTRGSDLITCRLTMTPIQYKTGSTSITVRASDGSVTTPTSRSFTLTVTSTNDIPTLASITDKTTNEDTPLAVTLSIGDPDGANGPNGTMGCNSTNLSYSVSDDTKVAAEGAVVWSGTASGTSWTCTGTISPVLNASGSVDITFTVNDKGNGGTGDLTASRTFKLNINAVNDAPTSQNVTLDITEDSTNILNSSQFPYTDVENNAFNKIIISVLPLKGTLQFNSSGTNWTAVSANQNITKADLDSSKLRYTPAANESGSAHANFSFKVSEGSLDSANSYTFTFNVTALNDPPVSTSPTLTINEDTVTTLSLANFGSYSDVENSPLSKIQVTSLPNAGTLEFNNSTSWTAVTLNMEVSAADITSGKLRFTPAPNATGASYASFGFKVHDGTDFSTSSYTLSISVTAQNDAPTSTDTSMTINEDTPSFVNSSRFGTYADVEGTAMVKVRITTLPNKGSLEYSSNGTTWAAATLNQEVTTADLDANRLRYTPASNEFAASYTTIGFKVSDGAALSVSAYTITINVSAVNDAPTSTNTSLTVPEDSTTVLVLANFGTYSDVENEPITSVKVTTLPTGSLEYKDIGNTWVSVILDQIITVADINNGRLQYTPATHANGTPYATLGFKVNDSSSASSPYTLTFNVTPVNDAPTSSNDSASTNEDTNLVLATTDFGSYSDVEGTALASVKIKSRSGKGVLQFNGGTWSNVATDQVITATDITAAKLRFSPDLNDSGAAYALIDFTVSDGTNESTATYTLTINVTAVNDAPVSSNDSVTIDEDTELTLQTVDFGTYSDVEGDALSQIQITALPAKGSLKLNGVAVTLNQEISKADIDALKLKFTPALNENGSPYTTLGFKVSDGSAYNTGSAYTLTINVPPVNDAPTGAAVCDSLSSGNVFRTSVANGGSWQLTGCAGASDVDGDTLTYKLTLAETGSSASAGYTCDPSVSSSAGGTSISGTFPNGATKYGSCRYTLSACDPSGQCSPASSNSVVISTYQLSVGTPSTPTLSSSCVVTSGGSITTSNNLSSVTWSGNTGAPSAAASTGTGTSATFSTDISAQLLSASYIPSTPVWRTTVSNLNASLAVTQATLAGAGANPPAAQVTGNAVSSATFTITRDVVALAERAGGVAGAASTIQEVHSDGQQPSYKTPTECNTCSTGPIASISAGSAHTCVVETSGVTKCWGSNANYEIGDNTTNQRQMPTSPANAAWTTNVQIAAGSNFSCSLGSTSDGIKCWGTNDFKQTGRNTGAATTKTPGDTPSLTSPISLSLSKTGTHACAVTSVGNAWCWGNNTNGQLGNNGTTTSATPSQVQLTATPTYLPSVRSIAAGGSHSCAALAYNASYTAGIYCWGLNTNGQLGDNSTTQRNMATAVDTINSGVTSSSVWFTQVVAGDKHTCALRNDGAVFCWGLNSSGQLGDGSTTQRNLPTAHASLGAGSGVVALTAGANHTCALKSSHEVVCWGDNTNGQLGNGTTTSTLTSAPVTALAAPATTAAGAVAISAGGSHTCAVFFDGTIRCWGLNSSGQLGDNSTTQRTSPVLVNWSAGVTTNANLRPQMCSKYTIP